MAHTHHNHSPHHADSTQGHLKFGIFLNLSFAVIEVIVGLASRSMAILTDAIHDFADSGSLLIALIAAKISERPSDPKRSFGYRRVSILAALINSSILLVTTGFIFYHAALRLFHPVAVESSYMFLVAGLSIIVNGAAVLRMRRDRKNNLNLEGAFWHLLEDALGGVTILVGGLIIHFTSWYWVDSLLSLLIGLLVLRGAWGIVTQSVHIFLEGTPRDVDLAKIERAILDHPEIIEVHHLHVWMLDTNHYNMSVHVRVQGEKIPAGLYDRLKDDLKRFRIDHLTVQVEGPEGDCLPCGN